LYEYWRTFGGKAEWDLEEQMQNARKGKIKKYAEMSPNRGKHFFQKGGGGGGSI